MQAVVVKYGDLCLSAGFLLVRVAALFVVALFALTDIPAFLVFAALGVIVVASLSLAVKKFAFLTPYAFLGSAALWGGVATAAILDGKDPITALIAIMVAIYDASAFNNLHCRGTVQ